MKILFATLITTAGIAAGTSVLAMEDERSSSCAVLAQNLPGFQQTALEFQEEMAQMSSARQGLSETIEELKKSAALLKDIQLKDIHPTEEEVCILGDLLRGL